MTKPLRHDHRASPVFGSRPFSRADEPLVRQGREPVDGRLP
nr:hypothetical protein [Streptomyces yerevanensis]